MNSKHFVHVLYALRAWRVNHLFTDHESSPLYYNDNFFEITSTFLDELEYLDLIIVTHSLNQELEIDSPITPPLVPKPSFSSSPLQSEKS